MSMPKIVTPKTTSDRICEMVGWIVGALLSGLLWWWENHVLHYYVLGYWQWVAMTFAFLVAGWIIKPMRFVYGLVLAVCIIAQMAAWLGIITLPLIKP